METQALVKTFELDVMLAALAEKAVAFGMKLIAAVALLIIGMWLARWFTSVIKRGMARRELEPSLQTFVGSFVNILFKAFVIIIVLATVGVQMTSIVAVLGAASLAVGMALSGTLQNFAGGIVILIFKPFKVGDVIETATNDVGVVKKIMIFTTELHTFDNEVLYLPNGALANGVINNQSQGGMRRTDLTVGVAYGTPIDKVRKEILKIVNDSGYIAKKQPEPEVFISSLGDNSVILTVRYWTKYADLLPARNLIMERIYTELPKKKISFPFPQVDVHVIK